MRLPMVIPPTLPPGIVLLQGFDLIQANPGMGIEVGARVQRGLCSVPLVSQKDAALYFSEDMWRDAWSLTRPADFTRKPLEESDSNPSLGRRLYLNLFSVETRDDTVTEMEVRRLGLAQYYPFAPGRILSLGKAVDITSVFKNRRPLHLDVAAAFNTRDLQVRQRGLVGYAREAYPLEVAETSVRSLRFDLLRRFLDRDTGNIPENLDETFRLSLGLAVRFLGSHGDVFREGAVLMVLDRETEASFGPSLPVKAMYHLSLGPRHSLRLSDMGGRRIDFQNCLLDGAHFLISSKLTEAPDRRRPALTISWDRNGFCVLQRSGPGGPPALSTMRRLFEQGYREGAESLETFDRLPTNEKIGTLAAYEAILKGGPSAQA